MPNKFFIDNPDELPKRLAKCPCCDCELSKDNNYRRRIQIRGARVNTMVEFGGCSLECCEKWWTDNTDAEELVEGPDPEGDAALEARVWDFCTNDPKKTLKQVMPQLVFHGKNDFNQWWKSADTEQEQEERRAALEDGEDHRRYERNVSLNGPRERVKD